MWWWKGTPWPIKSIVKLVERKGPKFTTYMPFIVPRVKILQEAFSAETLPPPRKKSPPSDANDSKHY